MYPSRKEAHKILAEAVPHNPGPWETHSKLVALCAERIAAECGLDTAKAYVCGLLHDIGRRFGVKHLAHTYDGYQYMKELGYDDIAKICLTHSFHNQDIHDYVGNYDLPPAEFKELQRLLEQITYDDYDRLIQLCDGMATGEAIVDIEERLREVQLRYGFFPKKKLDKIMELRAYFEEKIGKDIYAVVV